MITRTAALAGLVIVTVMAAQADETTARIALQNSSGITLHMALDGTAKTITVRRARFDGSVGVPDGKTALFVAPADSYAVRLPAGAKGIKLKAGGGKPSVVILTRVRAGKVDLIQASAGEAAEKKVDEPTEAEKADLLEKMNDLEEKKARRVPTTRELLPILSLWGGHVKSEAERQAELETERRRRIADLAVLNYYHFGAVPYNPYLDNPYYGTGHRRSRRRSTRTFRPEDTGHGTAIPAGARPVYRRYRPAVVVSADGWRYFDGLVFLHHTVGNTDFWLRWDF